LAFTNGRTEQDYNDDLLLRSAVERQIEIVGEAARGVSAAFKESHPEIPWNKVTSTRHILAHDHGMIKPYIMWRVVSMHLPELLEKVRPLVPPPPTVN